MDPDPDPSTYLVLLFTLNSFGATRIQINAFLKGFATFWEFSFYGQKKVADYEYHSLFAEKINFHT